jgi:AGZA family xanthine/uracil permease-like MFS transporter
LLEAPLARSALYLGILAVFSFFGVIHSSSVDGNIYLPWTLASPLQRAIPYQYALAYMVFAAMLLLLSLSKESKESPADLDPPGMAA